MTEPHYVLTILCRSQNTVKAAGGVVFIARPPVLSGLAVWRHLGLPLWRILWFHALQCIHISTRVFSRVKEVNCVTILTSKIGVSAPLRWSHMMDHIFKCSRCKSLVSAGSLRTMASVVIQFTKAFLAPNSVLAAWFANACIA